MDGDGADASGDGGRVCEDRVTGRGDVVAAGGGDIGHGGDHDLARLPGAPDGLVDLLRARGRSARAVDPQQNALRAVVLDGLLDLAHDIVGARGRTPEHRESRLAGDDHAVDADERDALAARLEAVDAAERAHDRDQHEEDAQHHGEQAAGQAETTAPSPGRAAAPRRRRLIGRRRRGRQCLCGRLLGHFLPPVGRIVRRLDTLRRARLYSRSEPVWRNGRRA